MIKSTMVLNDEMIDEPQGMELSLVLNESTLILNVNFHSFVCVALHCVNYFK